ncbi:hypothetical protein SALBM311S_08513 [Streptomyces alboniger]
MITECLAKGSKLDLSRQGCTLTGATPRPDRRDSLPGDQDRHSSFQTREP